MKVEILVISIILFLMLNVSADFDMKIMSMENCSSSQKTLYILDCAFSECCLNFSANFLKPLQKLEVSLMVSTGDKKICYN